MLKTIVTAGALALGLAGGAQAQGQTALDLYNLCKDRNTANVCDGYLVGILDGLSAGVEFTASIEDQALIDLFVEGKLEIKPGGAPLTVEEKADRDRLVAERVKQKPQQHSPSDPIPLVCAPTSWVPAQQLRMIFIRYAETHPTELSWDRQIVAVSAIRKAFPCAKTRAG